VSDHISSLRKECHATYENCPPGKCLFLPAHEGRVLLGEIVDAAAPGGVSSAGGAGGDPAGLELEKLDVDQIAHQVRGRGAGVLCGLALVCGFGRFELERR
jgi:hypothetical protein